MVLNYASAHGTNRDTFQQQNCESQPQQQFSQPQSQAQGQYGGPTSQQYGHNVPPPVSSQLPQGWIQQWDQNSQRYYYVEQATGKFILVRDHGNSYRPISSILY